MDTEIRNGSGVGCLGVEGLQKGEVGGEVVYYLSEDSSPVDAVHGAEVICCVEFCISEECFDDVLIAKQKHDMSIYFR